MTSALVRGTLSGGEWFAGRYRIVRALAAGGMGAVYEVVDEATQSPRALKVMLPSVFASPEHRQRFEREARVTGSIESEHLVRITDAGIDGDVPFLVMELLRGEDLRTVLKQRGALPSDVVVPYLRQVALALEKTHAAGIIHRDLKPANLFLTRRDDGSACLKVLDFGVAKLSMNASAQETSTVGTPIFMAPEQARGEGGIDHRADLLALAHVAYNMLVGEPYFAEELERSDSILGVILSVVDGPKEAPGARAGRRRGVRLPPAFDAWFLRAAAVAPTTRFSGAQEQVEALARALAGTARSVQHRTAPMQAVALSPPGDAPSAIPTRVHTPAPAPSNVAQVLAIPSGIHRPSPALQSVDLTVPSHVLDELRTGRSGVPPWAWAAGGLAVVGLVLIAAALGAATMLGRAKARVPDESEEEDDAEADPREKQRADATSPSVSFGCMGQACAPFRPADPARVEPLDHWDAASKLASGLVPGACAFMITAEPSSSGRVDTSAGGKLMYGFRNSETTVIVHVAGGQLAAVASGSVSSRSGPLPCFAKPRCSLEAASRAVDRGGKGRRAPREDVLLMALPSSAWRFEMEGRDDVTVDAVTCAVSAK